MSAVAKALGLSLFGRCRSGSLPVFQEHQDLERNKCAGIACEHSNSGPIQQRVAVIFGPQENAEDWQQAKTYAVHDPGF